MSDRNLTPYFLTIGPVLLVGAFMMWPASEAIGARGTQSLVDAMDTLMPLLIAGTLGTILVLGGVYLLISEMMENLGSEPKVVAGHHGLDSHGCWRAHGLSSSLACFELHLELFLLSLTYTSERKQIHSSSSL